MSKVVKLSEAKAAALATIESKIAAKVNRTVLGNSHRSIQDLCADLVNNSDQEMADIAHDCFLHPTTVRKLAGGITRFPRADTCERVLKHFQLKLHADCEVYSPRYRNQKKD